MYLLLARSVLTNLVCFHFAAAMKHLRPEQIFVMDNATFLDPPDNTREVLAEADLHEVNYSRSLF